MRGYYNAMELLVRPGTAWLGQAGSRYWRQRRMFGRRDPVVGLQCRHSTIPSFRPELVEVMDGAVAMSQGVGITDGFGYKCLGLGDGVQD